MTQYSWLQLLTQGPEIAVDAPQPITCITKQRFSDVDFRITVFAWGPIISKIYCVFTLVYELQSPALNSGALNDKRPLFIIITGTSYSLIEFPLMSTCQEAIKHIFSHLIPGCGTRTNRLIC